MRGGDFYGQEESQKESLQKEESDQKETQIVFLKNTLPPLAGGGVFCFTTAPIHRCGGLKKP